MNRTTKLVLVLVAMLVAATAGGLGAYAWSGDDDDATPGTTASAPIDPSEVAETAFPDLAAPSGEPELPGLDTAAPSPGTVAQVPGPFDDRLALHELAVRDGVVSGHVAVTSDVSELLELQVLVGFYDATGAYLGTGRSTFHLDESEGHGHEHGETEGGPPSELQAFRVQAPARYADDVAAATVGVPVLVNE